MSQSPEYRRILHRMGYYNYQHGLIHRHLNQNSGWDDHLKRCREFILKAADIVKPEKISVLGSGWLMELPLAELSERTRQITLYDIVHPPEVIEQTAQIGNVKLLESDLSGGLIAEVWSKAGGMRFFNRLKSLEDINIPEFIPADDPGMIISLNLLTQLEILPEKLLRKKISACNDKFMTFRKRVQENHIAFLKKHTSVIISDVAEILIDADGTSHENQTLLTSLPEGRIRESWIWDFDLAHADYIQRKSQFRVAAALI